MKHRPAYYPDTDFSQKIYPKVLVYLQDFEKLNDTYSLTEQEFENAYQALAKSLQDLTKKEMGNYPLWEWWEGEGIEVLAFRISLPNPTIYQLNQDELRDIVDIIQNNNYPCQNEFENQFCGYFDKYFHQLLALNFPKSYEYDYFLRHCIGEKYIEFNIDDIVECIFSNKPYQYHKTTLFKKYGA
ncbi:hypothetical protein [Moraxella oblonga]|uniref:hypothetical protein n=1 Tax=Moraxella oblonga TaxID=200413 RepID=UPI0008379A4A|nr:hypothetical protein [Moraxella oblonga]